MRTVTMQDPFLSLHCCVGVDRDITNPNLFRHFLDYYIANGVEKFDIVLHTAAGDEQRLSIFKEILNSKSPENSVRIWQGKYCCYVKASYQNEFIAQRISPSGWGILCDADEFHLFDPQRSLREFLLGFKDSSINSFRTVFHDQTTEDGELPQIRYPDNLLSQFPRVSQITRVLQTYTKEERLIEPYIRKIACVRRGVTVTLGHHNTQLPTDTYPVVLSTRHFKWDDLLIKRLRNRTDTFDRDPAKYSWVGEFHSALGIISQGKIPRNLLDQAIVI